MSHRRKGLVILMIGLIFTGAGCTGTDNNTEKTDVVGGVAVGVSPKVVHAHFGDNVSFNVDLESTENAEDTVTLQLKGSWLDQTFSQDIGSGETVSVPVYITVPQGAGNMSFTVSATSGNLGSTSSTTGVIIINTTGGK